MEKLERFMKTPWKFVDQTLPKELPPIKVHVPLKNLPIVGYLEETLSDKITEGLQELSKFKPKYPFKTLSHSAELFFALYLKSMQNYFTLIYRPKSELQGMVEKKLQGKAGQVQG